MSPSASRFDMYSLIADVCEQGQRVASQPVTWSKSIADLSATSRGASSNERHAPIFTQACDRSQSSSISAPLLLRLLLPCCSHPLWAGLEPSASHSRDQWRAHHRRTLQAKCSPRTCQQSVCQIVTMCGTPLRSKSCSLTGLLDRRREAQSTTGACCFEERAPITWIGSTAGVEPSKLRNSRPSRKMLRVIIFLPPRALRRLADPLLLV